MCFAYLSLANNHILDYCEAGMVQTMRTLKVGWGWMMVQTMRTLKVGWGGKMVQTMRTLKVSLGGRAVLGWVHVAWGGCRPGGWSGGRVQAPGVRGLMFQGLQGLDFPGPPGP